MKHQLPAELLGTDRILQRWAVSVGDGLYDVPWEDVPRNRVPVLDDQTAIVVDQLYLRSPGSTQVLVALWYRTPLTEGDIAKRLHIHRDTLHVRWNSALWYFRARFESSPLSGLRRLCLADPSDRLSERSHKVVASNSTFGYKSRVDWASCRKTPPAA